MPKLKTVAIEALQPTINTVADDMPDLVRAHLRDYEGADLDATRTDVEGNLNDAVEEVGQTPDETPERRVAVVKVAVRALAILVLDEVQRGESRIERETARMRKRLGVGLITCTTCVTCYLCSRRL